MNFWQESVDNFMRNRAYIKVSQILSQKGNRPKQYSSLPFVAGVIYFYETPSTPMFATLDTYVLLI